MGNTLLCSMKSIIKRVELLDDINYFRLKKKLPDGRIILRQVRSRDEIIDFISRLAFFNNILYIIPNRSNDTSDYSDRLLHGSRSGYVQIR